MSGLAITLLLAQAAAPAVQWERVHEGTDAIVFVDPASMQRSGDEVRMRQRTEFRDTDTDGMRSLVFTATVNCSTRTYRMHRMEGYREDGSLIRAIDLEPDNAQADIALAANDPSGQALYRRSCERTES